MSAFELAWTVAAVTALVAHSVILGILLVGLAVMVSAA